MVLFCTLIFLSLFLYSDSQLLLKNMESSVKLKNSEVENLRAAVMHILDEKGKQEVHLKNVESILNAAFSKNEIMERKSKLFQTKLEFMESKLKSHASLIYSVQEQGRQLDEKLNLTFAKSFEISSKLYDLSNTINEMEENFTAALSDQNSVLRETKKDIVSFYKIVDPLQNVSNRTVQDIKESIEVIESRMDEYNSIYENMTSRVDIIEEFSNLLEQKITKSSDEIRDSDKNVLDRFENLEESDRNHMSFLNDLRSDISDMMEKSKNHSYLLSDINNWMCKENGSLSNLHMFQPLMDSNYRLQNRVRRLEQSKNNTNSMIDYIKKVTEQLHVRLVNGGTYYGRVEVFMYGKGWGTVCDDSFGTTDANVICRQLGFRSGSARSSAHYGEGTVDIIMDDVGCTGSEKALQDCPHNSNHNCAHSEDVSVDCSI